MEKPFTKYQIEFALWLYTQDRDPESALYDIVDVSTDGYFALVRIKDYYDDDEEMRALKKNFHKEIKSLNHFIERNKVLLLHEWRKYRKDA